MVDGDQGAAAAAVADIAERTCGLLRGADTSRPVPGLEWTVGETAAHLVVAFRLYAATCAGGAVEMAAHYAAGGDLVPERLAEGNARTLQEVPRHDAGALADALSQAVRAFLASTDGRPAETAVAVPWFGERESRALSAVTGLALGELLVHGYDVARSLGRRWPIDAKYAGLALHGAMSVVPLLVNPAAAAGVNVAYAIHVRGGPRYVLRFRNGALIVDGGNGRIDCHLSVDPVAFLLVGYGRMNQWRAIAKGQLLAWGRRPWLGLKLKSLLLNP